jgi:hypothetical protein
MQYILYYTATAVTSSCISAYFISLLENEFNVSLLNQATFLMPYTVVSILSYAVYSYYITRRVDEQFVFPSMLGCAMIYILLPISLYMIGNDKLERAAVYTMLAAMMSYTIVTPFIFRLNRMSRKALAIYLLILPILSDFILLCQMKPHDSR